MPQKPPPVVLAIVVCDLIIRDELTKKLTLVGVFSAIHGVKLPVTLGGGMHLYAAMTDGRGEYKCRVVLRHLETDMTIFQAEGPLVFRDPQQVVELNMKLPQVSFPHWGRYEVALYSEEQLLGTRTFIVRQVGASPAGESEPRPPSVAGP